MMLLIYAIAWIAVAGLADRYARRLSISVPLLDALGIFWLILALLVLVCGGSDLLDRIIPLALVAGIHLHLVRIGNAPVGWRDITQHMADRVRQALRSLRGRLRI